MHLACPNHISARHWYALLTAQCRCCYQRMGRMLVSQLVRWPYVVSTVPGRTLDLHACLMARTRFSIQRSGHSKPQYLHMARMRCSPFGTSL